MGPHNRPHGYTVNPVTVLHNSKHLTVLAYVVLSL